MSGTFSASGPGSKAEQKVDDDENQSQNATIRRIQSFRDDLADYQLLFAKNELTGEVPESQQHRAYHQLAKGFLQLLKPYLTNEDIPQATEYWHDVEIGSFTVEPPAVLRQPAQSEVETAIRAGHGQTLERADPRNTVEPKHYQIVGLRDFAAAKPEWQVSWRVMYGPEVSPADLRSDIQDPAVRVQPRKHRNAPITVVKTARVPRDLIGEVVTKLENFVGEIGMDIEMEAEPYEGEGGPGL